MKVESVLIKKLANDPNNARKHSPKNIAAIKGSLAKFGQQKPIVVDKNNIVIAGNGTLEAAIELGWEKIDIVRTSLEGYQASAFALADNRTSELAEWDFTVLAQNLESLKLEDYNIGEFGFDDSFLKKAEDKLPEPGDGVIQESTKDQWDGMPEFDQQDKTSLRHIIVHFKTEEDAASFSELIGQNITDKTRSIWHPKAEIERMMDKRYEEEGVEM